MTDIVNLRRARKARARADKEATAAQNRALFGKPKWETGLAMARAALESVRLDGHRRAKPGSADDRQK